MVTYQAPGVYVQEVPSGSRPIEGIGTSVAAFVGFTEKGPVGRAVRVTNWTQYQETFGGFTRSYTPLAVYGFFMNGGGNCYVIRIGGEGDKTPARLALPGRASPQESLRISAKLGYRRDGTRTIARRGEPAEEVRLVVAREGFARPEWKLEVEGVEGCLGLLGAA